MRNPGRKPDDTNTARWLYTDDTQMALSVVRVLAQRGGIDQDLLAHSFAEHYEDWRGYGMAMHGLLPRIARNEHWLEAAQSLFSGQGSFGNGAAMRVAPVGAYFADDLVAVVDHAARSAEVTHAHPEGIAGAIAVAVASAWAWRLRGAAFLPDVSEFLSLILPAVPLSQVNRKLQQACTMGAATLEDAIRTLGNGSEISAQDTAPFALWCAAHHLNDFHQALLFTAAAMGDCDTNCAIVGGIVVMCAGVDQIPAAWLSAREPLPDWWRKD
jgi:ADP-ribosylglycohydrolase